MTEPTDAELYEQWCGAVETHVTTRDFVCAFARAVLAKWGAQPAPADSALEDAARLKVAVDLLEELAEHDSYSTEYDGRMVSICPECGEQEGEHRPNCAFVRAKTYLAAHKQGANHD